MTRRHHFSIFVMVMVLILCLRGNAQTTSASLSGHVTDPAGAVVPGASITVTNTATDISTTTKTNGAGDYAFATLAPGSYRLTVQAQGFNTSATQGIVLHAQDNIAQNVALHVGATSETVTVNADTQQINTQDATVSTVVERQYAADMPLNGRSFQGLISLAPGVGTLAANSNTSGQFVVNGQRTDTTYFTVDGASANVASPLSGSISANGTGNGAPTALSGGYQNMASLDDLEEFKISTSSFAPEFGSTPGGQIALVTRSGNNKIHGDAFDYYRSTVLDANDWFLNAANKARGIVQQNDFGGTVGGPVLKNKLFYFLSYEGLRLGNPSPSIDEEFTSSARSLAAAAIDNGVTGYMAQFLNAFPLPDGNPTTICTSSASCSAPHTLTNPTDTKLNTYSGRVDYTMNSRMTFFERYSHAPSSLTSYNDVAITTDSGGNDTYTTGFTYAITPTLNNDFHFNYTNTTFTLGVEPVNFAGSLSTIFPTGFAMPPSSYPAGEIGMQIPAIPGGESSFKIQPLDAANTNTQYAFTDAVSWTKGRHQLKFGVDFRDFYPVFNQINFNSLWEFTSTTACPGNLPAYICGIAALTNMQHNVSQDFKFSEFAAFAQDTWKISNKLTATYGLRWEVNPAANSDDGYPLFSVNAASFNLANMTSVTLNSFGTSVFPTTWHNVSPRIGLAYQLSADAKWGRVVRVGYGLFYDTGNQAFSEASDPWNARCNNLTACLTAPYTGPAEATVQFPISVANQRYAAPPVVPNPPSFPLAEGTDDLVDPNYDAPYVHQTNITFEQQLGAQQSFALSYIGAFGRDLLGTYLYPPDQTNPNELGQGSGCASAPNCGDGLYILGNFAVSSYNALQAKVQRQFAKGLGFTASYAWSHSIDNNSTNATLGTLTLPTASAVAAGQPDLLNRGASDFDMRQILSLSLVSEIPGPKKGIGKEALGGWSVDPLYHYQTALPVNAFISSTGTLGGATGLSQFPNLIQGVPIYVTGSACAAQYITIDNINGCPGGKAINDAPVSAAEATSAGCVAPTATNAKGAFCTPLPVGTQAVSGNFGRNVARLLPLQELDLSAHKDFPIWEAVHFRFQADMFNLFNHPQFGAYTVGTGTSSAYGLVTTMANAALGSGNSSGAGNNSIYATGGPRNFQFSGKITF